MPFGGLEDLLAPALWPLWVHVSARVVGVMVVVPIWRLLPAPAPVRALLVALWAGVLTVGIPATARPTDLALVPIATELVLGMVLGIVPLVLLAAAGVAGDAVGLQSGLTLGGALSPSMEGLGVGWGEWFGWLALCVFMVLRGDLMVLEALRDSFVAVPPGAPWPLEELTETVIRLPVTIIGLGLQIASPILLALFVANLGLGLLNRAVPQLNVMMSAFPVTIGLSLLMGFLGVMAFARAFARVVEGMPGAWGTLLGALGGVR